MLKRWEWKKSQNKYNVISDEEKIVMNSTGEKHTSKILEGIYDLIVKISKFVDKLPDKLPEVIVLLIYVFLHCLIVYYHEPWYDEAQAWNIARDGSLKEILFDVPKYEGHPALWYIILIPFAKTGLNYEFSLGIVSLLFSGISVFLLIFRSPFPRIVRLAIPFSFFIFYQYGVISRPYCVMMLAFVLLGMVYKDRNTKPMRFTIVLILLCATNAYGIVLSGGIALSWCIEIVREKGFQHLLHDKRVVYLALLLLYALFVFFRVFGENATSFSNNAGETTNSLLVRLVYVFFAMIADLFITNTLGRYDYIKRVDFVWNELLVGCIIGLVILVAILWFSVRKKTTLVFIIPYILFSVFGAIVYSCAHHVGIMYLFILFWLWISLENKAENDSEKEASPLIIQGGSLLCTLALIIPIVWNISSCICEINNNYDQSRTVKNYLAENNLLDAYILFDWPRQYDEQGSIIYSDLKHCSEEVALSPYVDNRFFLNWPYDASLYPTYYRSEDEAFQRDMKEKINQKPVPGVLINEPDIGFIYGNEIEQSEYSLVCRVESGQIWKGIRNVKSTRIYVRNDLIKIKK